VPWRELTERDGRSVGGSDSEAVNGELWHWSGKKVMGSGGASCVTQLEEKRGAGKRKRVTALLDAFCSATAAWSSGGGGGLVQVGRVPGGGAGEGSGRPATAGHGGGGGGGGGRAVHEHGRRGAVREGGYGAWASVALGCWAICYGPDLVNNAVSDLFKKNQANLNLIRSKDGFPELKMCQIKYGIEGN
jgi:hypothetical protein